MTAAATGWGSPDRPRRRPGQLGPRTAGQAAAQLRPGHRLRDLGEPVPALAQGQPPRPHPRRLKRKASQAWLFATLLDRIAARRSTGSVLASSASHARSGHVKRE